MSSSRSLGYVLAGAGAALFSTKAIFIKLAFQEQVDGALMLAWRMIFALPFYIGIGVWALLKRRRQGAPPPTGHSLALASITGFFGYYLASTFDFAGLQYISAELERLVLFTYPVFIMFLGAAFGGPRITAVGLAAAAVTYTGLAIVFAADLPEGGRETILGTVLVLGAALTFACHHLLAKRVLPALGSALFTAVALSTAAVFCIAHQVVIGSGSFAASPRFLWLAFGCAIVATVMPTLLINAGIARTTPQAVAMISNISPLVTIGLAVALLGETFTATDAVGAFLVLAGVGLYTWGEGRTGAARVGEGQVHEGHADEGHADEGLARVVAADLPGDEQDIVASTTEQS